MEIQSSDFLFHLQQVEDLTYVTINSRKYWNDNKGLCYGTYDFTKEESEFFEYVIEPMFEKIKLENGMEGSYEIEASAEETRKLLLEIGLSEDAEFNIFMDSIL